MKTASRLGPKGFFEIQERLPRAPFPVRALYGEEDRILPDVARTMRRVAHDLPGTVATPIPGCGHFLQEDQPERVAEALLAFL